jgi:hypothetical protein
VIDVQVRAEHVRDVLEAQPGSTKIVEPRLLGKIEWRGMPFVLAGAGVDQNRVLGGAHDKGLVGDDHPAAGWIEHHRVHFSEMPTADRRIIGREHVLGLPPWPVALDDACDGHVADGELLHNVPTFSLPGATLAPPGESEERDVRRADTPSSALSGGQEPEQKCGGFVHWALSSADEALLFWCATLGIC